MGTKEKKIIAKIDASVFNKQVGDAVRAGEVLGSFAGNDVLSPCDGVVDGVSFDSDDHALIIAIQPQL